MTQEHATSGKKSTEDEAVPTASAVDPEKKQQLDEDIDAILDEIDDVLEVNADEFVKAYIQKGGQ